ncbi:BTAD domain-containing putative transcriptional regulator [Nonomuraea soli]|uniref:BTAD domain-containing putative transcriptional regulator n=1 Tax=Nonomuraea soli TaxID=1032476 RepID=UPI0015EB6395
MRFGLLGPLGVWTDDGEPVSVPGLKVRALLADLLLSHGRVVSVDRLVDDLWGEEPPSNPTASLQVRVSQLRKAIGAELVVSRAPGYLLQSDAIDVVAFHELVNTPGDAQTRVRRLEEALRLWRGPALADFADEEFARAAVARLEEQRLACAEELAEARLELGMPVDVAELVDAHPLRERLRAVQIKALYRAGRQGEALDAYQDLRDRLADELGLDPSPELAELYQRILRQDPALSAPRAVPASNLPAALVELIGRDEALAEIGALLEGNRLVTLTGSGGVGKTTLALEAARGRPAWLVELAGADARTDLAAHLAASLGLRDDVPLVEALRERSMLIVLDNCEHVIDQAAGLAGQLLRGAPGLSLLATSREPLGVPGEAVWSVPPLDLSDAMRLFRARSKVADGQDDGVALLCKRLDGIPLALELAATRVRALGVDGLVSRLDDRFRLLQTGHRGAPPRQQTLTAMIAWSWDLLSADERVVLRRLAAHADGCTLEAAEAVCAEPGLDVLDLLVRLVDRSLVTVVHGPGATRYRLLESVAAFCAERLREAGEEAEVRRRHAAYYTELAERADLHGLGQAEWLKRLDSEAANLRAAQRGPYALRLVNALGWYWYLRGRLVEARRALAAALEGEDGVSRASERARALAWQSAFAAAQGERTTAVPYEDIADPGERARAQWFHAIATNDLDRAPELLERFRAVGDRWGEGATLILSAMAAHMRADLAELESTATRAAELLRDDPWGSLRAAEWLAALAEMTGDYERAVLANTEALRLAEELGLWPDAADRLCWLGWIATQRGEHEQAFDLGQRALDLATEQGFRTTLVFARTVLGYAARRSGRLDLAERHLRLLLEPGAVHNTMILIELGYIAELRGQAATAMELHRQALDEAKAMDAPGDIAGALEGLAGAHALAGLFEEAARLLDEAASTRLTCGMPASPALEEDLARIRDAIYRGQEPS